MVPVALAFGLGITADRWLWGDSPPPGLWLGYLVMGLITLGFSYRTSGAGPKSVALTLLLISVSLAGAARHHLHWRMFPENDIGRFARDEPQAICLEVVLSSVLEPSALSADSMTFPEPKPFLRGTARAVALRDGTTWRTVSGKLLLSVAGTESPYQPGDRLRIVGKLTRPPLPENPGQFDLREYRRADRILAQVTVEYPEGMTRVRAASFWNPVALLGRWRSAARDSLRDLLPESDHALAQALLLGFRNEIPEEFEDALLKTGTIHLLAISGLHVGILAGGFGMILRVVRFPRRFRPAVLLVLTILYVALAGGQPSTIRASVALGLFLIGCMIYRPTFSMNTLAVAAMILLLLNPSDLFRVGPQLSFLAASVLIVVQPMKLASSDSFTGFIAESRPRPIRWLQRLAREQLFPLLILSVAVWLVTQPLVVYQFHIVNPLGVVLTPILVLPITVTLLTGFLLILFGPVIGVGTLPLAWLCHGSLRVTEAIITWACQLLPFYRWLPGPPQLWVIGFYMLWLVYLVWGWRGPRWLSRPLHVGIGLWLIAGILFFAIPRKTVNEARFTLLSVGHGLAGVLELPNGEVWVYDVGSFGNQRWPARIVAGYLWSRGYRHIDAVIISHADLDHFNGLPLLMDYFPVKRLLVSPQMFQRREAAVEELRRLVVGSRIRCETVQAGRRWECDGCRVTVIHPPASLAPRDDNATSVVILVDYAGQRILLPGDLEGDGTRAMVNSAPVTVDVLVSPHHGSVRGQAGDLVRWCRPRWLLVSGGRSSLETVKEHFQDQVQHILHTGEVGAVTVVLSSHGCEVKPWTRR